MQRAIGLFCLICTACSHGVGPTRQADGGYRLSCKGPLVDCLKQAERACRDQGYRVDSAHDRVNLLGAESGQSQVPVRKSDAVIYCGSSGPEDERPPIRLQREEAVPSPAASSAAPPAAPARVCVPGGTQACVGPGGCSGGQACASDGSHFDVCNCAANPPSSAPAPATAPAAPAP